ncbi:MULTISPECIES: SDR family NAD(P)-dependent oxidoreductase [Brevibacterium]|uniref:KR domain-containing protein n=2 Tax=Brevibacterium TaxID=1696 RepID=A0A2H1JSQ0_BREAU|nr:MULTISPECIES: SDR family NAD(P)-dependent oxidoreductase [Brevibacterium]MDN5551597.1 SDR family NAD(P)-dependent oxidoreductase [Brevibacterium sp.]AZL04385.1 KR domain-containing protein [Brevibacterium aurantiacum]AZL07982.1 KR domain-containing protein [Brevibacterium aurantiacum]AZL11597.1 KR domain-containing protein [Brevibacterium aurantiacum]AZT91944.1 KR domain-containing protein [Brevibacterium aurantiacum]
MSTLVIVGAGPGLGLSLAEKFGKKDFNVALIARNQDRLDTLQASLTDMNIKSAGFSADVTNEQQIADAFTQVRETFGQIDVLVYNAGVIAPVSAAETTADIANQHMQVNIIGGISSAQQVIPEMIERKQGTIFFTGGGASELTVTPILTTLSIGKSGLRSYAHCLHDELQDQGVYVGMLSIAGVIEEGTYFSADNIADEYLDMYEKQDVAERFYVDESEDSDAVLKDTYTSEGQA